MSANLALLFRPIKAVLVWGSYSWRLLVGINQFFAHCLHVVRRRSVFSDYYVLSGFYSQPNERNRGARENFVIFLEHKKLNTYQLCMYLN